MELSSKHRQALKAAEKRRERRPTPEITVVSRSLKIKNSERSRFTQRSAPVLLLLERTLLKCWYDNPAVDDLAISLALIAAIQHKLHDSEVVAYVLSRLTLAAEEANISEADWTTAQRIILESVTTRSHGDAGSRSYLNYCQDFVARAR